MSKPILTKEIAYKALQHFFNQKPFVLFATGTSCSVHLDYGMPALEGYLKDNIPRLSLTSLQKKEWERVLSKLEQAKEFEVAMNSIQDEDLLEKVIGTTAEHVLSLDQQYAFDILQGEKNWPAISLFARLVQALPETDRILHVATPNYDLLAEYAFTQAGILYSTGFWGGVVRQLDWKQAERQMTYIEKCPLTRAKVGKVSRLKKHIRLYKVHGSLNIFQFDHQVVETDAWNPIPNGVKRLMITPGTGKHEKLHNYRDTLLKEYDDAVSQHSAFLFLGFGFNDTQLVNNAIGDKLKKQNSSALIITRESNSRIDALLQCAKNTWLICKNEQDNSTRIFNSQYKDCLNLPDKELWQFDKFTTEIMGR